MDQCPICKAGRELPLGQWKKLRLTEVLPALEELRLKPGDREVADNALGLASQFGTSEEFEEVVELLLPHYREDPDMLVRMGWGLNRFNHHDQAQRLLNASLAIKDDAEIRQLMEFHQNAPKTRPPKQTPKYLQLVPLLIIPSIILFFFGRTFFAGFSSAPDYVFVVNGLPEDYPVLVGDQKLLVEGQKKKRLKVGYESVTVSPVPGESYPFEFQPITGEIQSAFSDRISGGKTFVFNPDKTALFSEQEIIYYPESIKVATEEMLDSGEYTFHTGKSFYQLPKTDYRFTKAPDTIQISGSRITKTALNFHYDLDPISIVKVLLEDENADSAVEYMRNQLIAAPETQASTLLSVLGSLSEPEDFLVFLESNLSRKPVLVEWHRIYQEMKRNQGEGEKILSEYKAKLAKDPNDASLTYLTARLMPDGAKQQALFRKSTQLNPPSAFGFYAISYEDWVHGRFDEALENIKRALELRPDVDVFQSQELEYLVASNSWNELEKRNRDAFQKDPTDTNAANQLIIALIKNSKEEEVKKVIDSIINAREEAFELPPRIEKQLRAVFSATAAVAARSAEKLSAAAKRIGTAAWDYQADLATGDISSAAKKFPEYAKENNGNIDLTDQLVLFAAAKAKGEDLIANDILNQSVEKFSTKRPQLFQWLKSDNNLPDLETYIQSNIDSSDTNVVAAALALNHPKDPLTRDYLDYSKVMNYRPSSYQITLDWIFQIQTNTGTGNAK